MSKPRLKKESELQVLKERLSACTSAVISSASGLTVKQTQDFKKEVKSKGGSVQSIKKTLLAKILQEKNLDTSVLDGVEGIVSIVTTPDEITAAKVTQNFAKKNKQCVVHFGIMSDKLLSLQEVLTFANLLSREELLAKLVGSIYNPVSGFVRVLNAIREKQSNS